MISNLSAEGRFFRPGWGLVDFNVYPRLAPWAKFLRRFAAQDDNSRRVTRLRLKPRTLQSSVMR
jgi:hypothetical protein